MVDRAVEAVSRRRHYRGRAEHDGRHVARRAEENRAATLAIAAAFGLGWLMRLDRRAVRIGRRSHAGCGGDERHFVARTARLRSKMV